MNYLDILQANKTTVVSGPRFKIKVLSNTTINPIKDILKYKLNTEGINADILIGEYDNIVQDSTSEDETNAHIIFWDI